MPWKKISSVYDFENEFYDIIIVTVSHKIFKSMGENLIKSPMFSGKIKGIGPRYCPSIEDKIVRFSDRPKHQLYFEEEWFNSNQIYINGFFIKISLVSLRGLCFL